MAFGAGIVTAAGLGGRLDRRRVYTAGLGQQRLRTGARPYLDEISDWEWDRRLKLN